MTLTITNTGQLILIDGVPCRLWEGTFGGVPVHVFVHRIAVPNEADQAAFKAALQETQHPDLLFAPVGPAARKGGSI